MRLPQIGWIVAVSLLALLWLRLSLFHGFAPRGFDDQHYFAQARSLVVDGDLDLERELTELAPRPENILQDPSAPLRHRTETGRVPCKYPIGAPLLMLPFHALGHWTAVGLASLGAPVATDGYSLPCYVAWAFGNLCWALVALVVTWRLATAVVPAGAAFLAVLTAFAASPLLYHTVGDPYMAHVPATALTCVLAWLVTHSRAAGLVDLRVQGLAGVVGGLAVATRPSEAPYLLALALPLLGPGIPPGRRLAGALASGAGIVAGFLPQALAWHAIYGRWIVYSYGEEGFRFPPFLAANLFGARAGLFPWNPLWLPALLAFFVSRQPLAPFRLPAAAVLLLNSAWWCHWWGDTYGGRAHSSLFPFAALGCAAIVRDVRGRVAGRGARVRLLADGALVLAAVLGLGWSLVMIVRMERLGHAERAAGAGFPWPFG